MTVLGIDTITTARTYCAWENIGGLKHWRMANLNQLANKKLANGLTWFQCKGVTEIIGENKLTNGSQFAKFANFSPSNIFPCTVFHNTCLLYIHVYSKLVTSKTCVVHTSN